MSEQNGISKAELEELGYVKLEDDEQVISKVVLTEKEANFMEENDYLSFYKPGEIDFETRATIYTATHSRSREDELGMYERLVRAYFNGYTVKKEPKYYIKFLPDNDFAYLNIDKGDGVWALCTKEQDEYLVG